MSRPKSAFGRELARRNTDPAKRRWLYVPYDQFTDALGPLSREAPEELGIVLVECHVRRRARRPYHKQKLALVLANLCGTSRSSRQPAASPVDSASRAVPYDRDSCARARRRSAPCVCMRPPSASCARRAVRAPVRRWTASTWVPEHEGWLTTPEQFDGRARRQRRRGAWTPSTATCGARPAWLMDDEGKPAGREVQLRRREPRGRGRARSADAATAADLRARRGHDRGPRADRARTTPSTRGRSTASTLPATQRRRGTALWAWAKRRVPARSSGRTRTR